MQNYFRGFEGLKTRDFGGSLLRGNAREARPISTKRAMHLVMRSTLATGPRSLLHPVRAKRIESLIRRTARSKGVRIYRYANAGNHLHLLILAETRVGYRSFIRTISGLIARLVLGAEKGKAQKLRFWDARPFTRIVEWGKAFRTACAYVLQNKLEALGFIPYRVRSQPNSRATRRYSSGQGARSSIIWSSSSILSREAKRKSR